MDASEKTALIDMDGTTADYDLPMAAILETLRAPGEPTYERVFGETEPAYMQARRKLVQSVPGFWRALPKLAPGFQIVEDLRAIGFRLHVLTKGPGGSAAAWGEKLLWCQEHLPDADVTVTMRKSLVYGRVLVDDFPPYFTTWLAVRPRGLVVCVAQPWNANYAAGEAGAHPNVFRYDGSPAARASLRARLQAAYDREGGAI